MNFKKNSQINNKDHELFKDIIPTFESELRNMNTVVNDVLITVITLKFT